eukprot:698127-Karenia_brevis.AAC.1
MAALKLIPSSGRLSLRIPLSHVNMAAPKLITYASKQLHGPPCSRPTISMALGAGMPRRRSSESVTARARPRQHRPSPGLGARRSVRPVFRRSQ